MAKRPVPKQPRPNLTPPDTTPDCADCGKYPGSRRKKCQHCGCPIIEQKPKSFFARLFGG